jgi:hypothetical protein
MAIYPLNRLLASIVMACVARLERLSIDEGCTTLLARETTPYRRTISKAKAELPSCPVRDVEP